MKIFPRNSYIDFKNKVEQTSKSFDLPTTSLPIDSNKAKVHLLLEKGVV